MIKGKFLNITIINSYILRVYESPGATYGLTIYILYNFCAWLLLDSFILGMLNDISYIISYINEGNNISLSGHAFTDHSTGSSGPSDPVRWWPTGLPQTKATIASGLGTLALLTRLGLLTTRTRGIAAVVVAATTTSNVIINSTLVKYVGFNRLMWGI